MTATAIPAVHPAGDSFAAVVDGASWPATDGWSAQLVLIGAANRYTITGTASGADFAFAQTAAETSSWVAGAYTLRALYTKAAQRYTQDVGEITITPDPAAGGTTVRSLMSAAELALADLETVWRAHLSGGNVIVHEHTIAGRQMRFRTIPELLQALSAARRDVQAERSAARAAAGLSPRKVYVTRM